jgi:hypothetical protein
MAAPFGLGACMLSICIPLVTRALLSHAVYDVLVLVK